MVKSRTGVAEWEEPRHSGRLMAATLPHWLPLCNTTPHFDVRLAPAAGAVRALSRSQSALARWSEVDVGDARTRARPVIEMCWAQSCVQKPHLHAASQSRTAA